MRLCLKNLVLEITRKCNMNCLHCMRGETQNVDMQYEVLEEIFSNIGYIGHLVLTGGEPSCASSVICHVKSFALKYGCKIGHFYCTTNAKEYNPFFCSVMESLYEICEDSEKCVLTITTDQFHEACSPDAVAQYQALPFYNPINQKTEIPKTAVIDRGNAKKNGIGFYDMDVPEYIFDIDITFGSIIVGDRIYINALGDVLFDADLSYEQQEKHSAGNVMNCDLATILFENLYNTQNQPDGHICKMTIVAEEGTIGDDEAIDERYFKRLSKALAAFSNFISNLQMTPSPSPSPSPSSIPLEVHLKVKTDLNQNFNENGQWPAQAIVQYYTSSGQHIGDVTVTLEFVTLEDENGG